MIDVSGCFKREAASTLSKYVEAQTGWPKHCKPSRRVVYLKTHKYVG